MIYQPEDTFDDRLVSMVNRHTTDDPSPMKTLETTTSLVTSGVVITARDFGPAHIRNEDIEEIVHGCMKLITGAIRIMKEHEKDA